MLQYYALKNKPYKKKVAYLDVLVKVFHGVSSHLHALQALAMHLLYSIHNKIDLTLHANYECAGPEDRVWAERHEKVGESVSTHR